MRARRQLRTSRAAIRSMLLIVYSFCPGLAKVFESNIWFNFGIVVFFAYLLVLNRCVLESEPTLRFGKKYQYIDIALIFIFSYTLVLNLILLENGELNVDAAIIGVGNFLIPLFLINKWLKRHQFMFINDLYYVGLGHFIVACILVIGFNFSESEFKIISNKVLEGSIPYRMSSVSGSAGFSALMTVCFALASCKYLVSQGMVSRYFYWISTALFFISALLSMQRASWVGVILISGVICFAKNGKKLIVSIFATTVLIGIISAYAIEVSPNASSIAIERFYSLGDIERNPISERTAQWLNLLPSLADRPFGAGIGQLGQAARIANIDNIETPIYDGDIFRIIAEYGMAGFVLALLILVATYRAAVNILIFISKRKLTSNFLYSAAFLSLVIQSFGSNLTEFYFVNSLFWSFMLMQLGALNPGKQLPLFPPEIRK